MVAQDKDTVSAAVHGAAALLYPFSWQHIYLPLLPLALKVTYPAVVSQFEGACGKSPSGGIGETSSEELLHKRVTGSANLATNAPSTCNAIALLCFMLALQCMQRVMD